MSNSSSFLHQRLVSNGDAAYLLALRITGNSADAEDVVQEAYLRALRFNGPIPEGSDQRKWFLRVVANAAKDLRAADASRRVRERNAKLEESMQQLGISGKDDKDSLRVALAEALASLDENLRVPVSLHYEHGMSYAEAAEILGAPEGTLRKYASRGIELLREKLARKGHGIASSVIIATLSEGLGVKAPAALVASVETLVSSSTVAASALKTSTVIVAGAKGVSAGLAIKVVVVTALSLLGATAFITSKHSGGKHESKEDKGPGADQDATRLRSVANAWISDGAPHERDTSCGKGDRFKLKSIQEMAAVRFDASLALGREVLKARLFLKPDGPVALHYLRVSTINQDWKQGQGIKPYGPGDGATFRFADHATQHFWAWPGSEFCDVIMGSGNSLVSWEKCVERDGGWFSVELAPDLIYAMAVNNTDGLALMEGGSIKLHNNFFNSAQATGQEPYIQVEYGAPLVVSPARPIAKAEPAPERSHMGAGALKLTIEPDRDVFCWRVTLNGKPVERWRVKHPAKQGATQFYLEDLAPSQPQNIEITAVSAGGQTSPSTQITSSSSMALSNPMELGTLKPPSGGMTPPEVAGRLNVWAFPAVVKLSPEKPEAMFNEESSTTMIQNCNSVWNGKEISLCGCKGEYVAYQLCIENIGVEPLRGIKVTPRILQGPEGASIGGAEIELFKNWYAQNKNKQWQPAYCVPLKPGATLQIPDAKRVGTAGFEKQQNQSLYVDIYIDKNSKAGDYAGSIEVQADGAELITLPVTLTVFDFSLPDKLSFWPELNTYNSPGNAEVRLNAAGALLQKYDRRGLDILLGMLKAPEAEFRQNAFRYLKSYSKTSDQKDNQVIEAALNEFQKGQEIQMKKNQTVKPPWVMTRDEF